MNIGKWSFVNRNLVNFIVAILVLGGIYGMYEMSKLEDPEIKVKLALVVTTYPGASASQVELEVTDPIEKSIRAMNDVANVESYSYNDLSIIQVELLRTVSDADLEQHWDELRRKVSDISASLPVGVTVPHVKDDFSHVYGMFYALTGEGMSDTELGDYAELIRRELLAIDGVDRVNIYGQRNECINISLDSEVMNNLGVSPAEVFSTLNAQDKTTYSGYFDSYPQRIRVNVTDRFNNVDDIADLMLQGHEGEQLRLRDIATIEKTYETPVRNEMFYDGRQAIGLLVSAVSGSDIVKVGKAVESTIARLQATRFPVGVDIEKVFFQPEKVTDALGNFFINLIESVAIVVVILMLAMGIRSGVIIAISLIVIVLGSFLFLSLFDGSMQRVSLCAFILAMGMLVDNAIVIIDGILVDLKKGKPRARAMTDICRQTAMPLLGATIIAILAFFPIFLSPDTAGVYVRDLFIVLAVSLLLSWALAMTQVPLLSDCLLPSGAEATAMEEQVFGGKSYDILRRVLEWGLSHRWLTVGIMVMLFLGSLFCFRFMKRGFFPDMEYNQLYIEYKLPEGTNSTKVKDDLREISRYLNSREEVGHITISIGAPPGRYNLVRSLFNPSLSYGELIVDFSSPESLTENIEEIQSYLSAHYPDAYVRLKRYNLMYKKYPIEVQVTGPDPDVLSWIADSIRHVMEASGSLRLITQDLEDKVPVINIEYDQQAARNVGLTRSDVSLSLLAANGGIPIGSFYDGIHRDYIYVKETDSSGSPITDIENLSVFSTVPSFSVLTDESTVTRLRTGKLQKDEIISRLMSTVPLRQVVKSIDVDWDYPVIPRYNGQRMVRVQASPAEGVEVERARLSVAARIESIQLPTGYGLEWQGEKEASTNSMHYLFMHFPLAIIIIIAVLIMLFKDYRKPVIILLTIPMVFIGVVLTLVISRLTFSFTAIVGTLGLIGMVIKNGIVLMDEVNLQQQAGKNQRTALIYAAQARLRPVSMAALTTILGMIPLLSDAMFGSMAAAIMGGLFFGTIITLVFLPVLYSLFFNQRKSS